ncbi:M23 family metallopeptidase [Streptomyces sp. NPDC052052]|uniref:M23 family metallopeptidase n=1 Tax=Streptomyces sp. NPDC052052 TaxID=3154756 RepID=UPI00344A9B3B
MDDQHPHAGYAGYDGQTTASHLGDPLFGSLPGSYDGMYDSGYGTGPVEYGVPYESTHWDTGAHPTTSYDAYGGYPAQTQQPYPAGPTYDTTATWTPAVDHGTAADTITATFADIPARGGAPDATGQWDTSGWYRPDPWAASAYDSGVHDATAWNIGATPTHEQQAPEAYAAHEAHQPYGPYDDQSSFDPYEPQHTAEFNLTEPETGTAPETGPEAEAGADFGPGSHDGHSGHSDADGPEDEADGYDDDLNDHVPAARRPLSRPVTRARRRTPAKRSALLTVAVPSACVMSVAGIAAASVAGLGGEDKKDDSTTMAAADPGSVKSVAANNKLDTQLANLSADAENFADRASRTQERIDLRERQAAEKKKREEEAARKEALRPKFVMPVKDHGLSAYFGQAGVNWMSVHTGIDFPVSYGTPVMAATDGTVRTQWNSAYGNMAIVTMADGTETWYCHLSSTKIRSGAVKAGDVIAYSGNSGNSTGPHMHFEVRPGGGAAIDPLPWLRSHNVDPT